MRTPLRPLSEPQIKRVKLEKIGNGSQMLPSPESQPDASLGHDEDNEDDDFKLDDDIFFEDHSSEEIEEAYRRAQQFNRGNRNVRRSR